MENTLINHPLLNSYFQVIKDRFKLTKRELEVLQILSIQGLSNRELAEALFITERTAKNHLASITTKLKVRSSREIQAVVFRNTLMPVLMNVFHTINNEPKGSNANGITFPLQQKNLGVR